MLFSGQAIKASLLPSGIAQLIFDLEGSSVNKFDQLTLKELDEAVAAIGESDARGVIFSSAKSTFIVGADITEFTDLLRQAQRLFAHGSVVLMRFSTLLRISLYLPLLQSTGWLWEAVLSWRSRRIFALR